MENYIVLKQAVSLELCKFLSTEYSILEGIYHHMYQGSDPSDFCKNSFARYAPLPFETLLIHLQPLIESTVKKRLYPTYSYARIYYKNSELEKHKDRKSSEITVSVCIEKDSSDWPLWIEIDKNHPERIDLDVGDLVIYSGRKQLHWREPFNGEKQVQAFLQYVDSSGDSSYLKYDTRPALGLPFEWTSKSVQDEINLS